MRRTLQTDKIVLQVTRSALDEISTLCSLATSKDNQSLLEEARRFGLDECEIIERGPNDQANSNPAEDILNLVGKPDNQKGEKDEKHFNKDGYIIATQDEALSDALRQWPNVPQMKLSRAVLLLESPSAASRRVSHYEERGKQITGGGTMTEAEREAIRELRKSKRKRQGGDLAAHHQERIRKKAKGPNPLSCKKKVTKSAQETGNKKRRRKKKKDGQVESTI